MNAGDILSICMALGMHDMYPSDVPKGYTYT